MNEGLPGLLEKMIHESRSRLEEAGFTLEVFDSAEHAEKKSFGVYVEKGEKGFFLTVWDSGEVQMSIIDYEVDLSPCENYLSDVHAHQLRAEFKNLVDWVSEGCGQS